MGKHHTKSVVKVQARRQEFDDRSKGDPSRRRPGSMNPKKQT